MLQPPSQTAFLTTASQRLIVTVIRTFLLNRYSIQRADWNTTNNDIVRNLFDEPIFSGLGRAWSCQWREHQSLASKPTVDPPPSVSPAKQPTLRSDISQNLKYLKIKPWQSRKIGNQLSGCKLIWFPPHTQGLLSPPSPRRPSSANWQWRGEGRGRWGRVLEKI